MKKFSLCCTFLILVLGLSGYQANADDANNLLENPSFENGFESWSHKAMKGAANWLIDTQIVSHCTASAHIRSDSSPGARIIFSQSFDVQADCLYKLTLDYRTEEDAEGLTTIRPVMSGNGAFLCYVAEEALAPAFGEWKKFTMFFKTHPLADQTTLEINVMRQSIWFDNVSVRLVKKADPGVIIYGFENIIQKPLYKELLTGEPRWFQVFPTWTYNLERNQYAFKFGFEYDYEQQFAEAGRNRLAVMTEQKELVSKYNVPVLGFVNNYRDVIIKSQTELGVSTRLPLTHPLTEKLMLEYIRKMHAKFGEHLWGLFYCDEPYNHAYKGYLPVSTEKRATEDWIRINKLMDADEIDQEIRKKYGNGKFGLPSSVSADEPYNWIAFRRWQDDQLYNLFSHLQAESKALNPNVLLLGPDEISAATPRDWERLASTWDISCGQSMPAWNNERKLITGFFTKLYSDLTFKPTAPFVQVCKYDHSTTPEFVQEQYSQVLRNGGSGYWINGVEWFDRELGHPKFNAPDRWDAMLKLTDTVRRTPELKFPKADCAIFYSIDTHQSFAQSVAFTLGAGHSTLANYIFVGPYSGSWFDMISERQILTGSRNLGDYKIIYIPAAKYLRQTVIHKLKEYVENGGILACFDPEAFSSDDFGEDITAWRKSLFGVSVTDEQVQSKKLRLLQSYLFDRKKNKGNFPVYTDDIAKLKVESSGASVLMEFGDGSPALVLNKVGKGKTLYAAYSPLNQYCLGSRQWQEFFMQLQSWSGCAINHAIWRFQLPLESELPEKNESICLTGNNVQMLSGEVTTPYNSKESGGYRYDMVPSEEGNSTNGLISFASGRLTNRRQAYESIRKLPRSACGRSPIAYKRDDWVISWNKTDSPLVISFEFNRPHKMDYINIFASGDVPEFKLYNEDGVKLGTHRGEHIDDDVKLLKVELKGSSKSLSLRFDPCSSSDKPFILSEIEIWAHNDE